MTSGTARSKLIASTSSALARIVGTKLSRVLVLSTFTLATLAVASGAWQISQEDAEHAPAAGLDPVGEPSNARLLPTGFGVKYDRAVALVVEINHLLERKQAALALSEDSRTREVVGELRAEVALLERQYVQAIAAMSKAAPDEERGDVP